MESFKKSFINDYFSLMETCYKFCEKNKDISYIDISTMTIISDLSCEINIKHLNDNFASPFKPVCFLKKTKEHNEYELTKRGKVKKSFYNQITIEFKDYTTKSVKIFSNGRLQMTGITSISEAFETVNTIIYILENTPNVLKTTCEGPTNMYIGMINTDFHVKHELNILKLKSLMESKNVRISYNPGVYPGLKIKIHQSSNACTSAFIFRSGRILITGAKSLSDIQNAYKIIAQSIYDNKDVIKLGNATEKQPKKTPKYSCAIINGYSEKLLNCVLCKN